MKARLLFAFCLGSFFLAVSAFGLEDPRLSVAAIPGNVFLSWPASATNWVLEQSAHLQPPIPWSRVSPIWYQLNATSRFTTVSAPDAKPFYRLRNSGPPVPGLTGYWLFEEATGLYAYDAAGTAPAFTIGNVGWSAGRVGAGALRFYGGTAGGTGSRAWVSNTNYRVLPPTGKPFSLSFWFKPDVVPIGWRGLAGNDADGSNGWHVAMHAPALGTNYLVFASTGASLSVTGRTLLLPGQWHQLTVTHDGTNGSVYLDSALLASAAGSITNHAGPIYIGGWVAGYDSLPGWMDDVRTYTNCLTAEQISLAGVWHFDEGNGGFAADSNIQGRHASVIGPAWTTGHDGAGINLNSSHVIIPNDDYGVLPPSSGRFSLSFWLRPQTLSVGTSGLMSFGDGINNGWRMAVQVEASGQTALHFWSTNTGGTLNLLSPVPLTNGVWTKFDLTFNGGIATLYANGVQTLTANGVIRGSTLPLILGVVPGLTNFNGVIDELKIYSRERDAAEIGPVAATMWETVFVNSTTNLVLQGTVPAGKTISYSLSPVVTATNGIITHTPGSPVVTYQAGNAKGPDTFAYTVSDGEFTSPPTIVSLSVVTPHWMATNGGSTAPLDGSSPAHAWMAGNADALDAIWKTNNYYDCFFYAPGEYQTRGWKYLERGTANRGCKHIGSGESGSNQTTLKLVDIDETFNEETFFAPLNWGESSDGFEVHQMVLDCNATNLPKYVTGEPVWLRIPLVSPSPVETVTLRWGAESLTGATFWQSGRAVELRLTAQLSGTNTYTTNLTWVTGPVTVLTVGTNADELLLELNRRAPGVAFYSLTEIEVSNAAVSLISATLPGGGDSRLDANRSIYSLVDDNPKSSWASGPEGQVQITLPLAAGTMVSQLNLYWNCELTNGSRLGPAANFLIRARNEATGRFYDVPFVSHGRTTPGWETNTFGTVSATNPIVTDQLVLVLTNREPGVDYYSLRTLAMQNGTAPVTLRMPKAMNWYGGREIFRAFDHTNNTAWVSGSQGAVSAMQVFGSNIKLTHLKIVGFGTTAARECFPLVYLSPGSTNTPRKMGNVLIEDCVVADPAPSNADGLTAMVMAAPAPDTLTNAVVRRCTVAGLRSHFAYTHGISAAHMENCLVDDCGAAVYFEPDAGNVADIGPVTLRSNRFVNVDYGFYLLSHKAARMDSLTFQGNEIVLRGMTAGGGFQFCDVCEPGTNGWITNVTILDNVVRYADWSPRPANSDVGFMYTDMQQVVLGNNVFALGTANSLRMRPCPAGIIPPPEPIQNCDQPVSVLPPPTYAPCVDPLLPGHMRAWFNNRDLSGASLEFRIQNNGVDGPASQQQWPE